MSSRYYIPLLIWFPRGEKEKKNSPFELVTNPLLHITEFFIEVEQLNLCAQLDPETHLNNYCLSWSRFYSYLHLQLVWSIWSSLKPQDITTRQYNINSDPDSLLRICNVTLNMLPQQPITATHQHHLRLTAVWESASFSFPSSHLANKKATPSH